MPLFGRGICDPGPWRFGHHAATWLEVARALPSNLGLEYTAAGWRIVTMPVATRRALDALDITEGEVIPDAVMRERRRRVVEADLMLTQARAVLQTVGTASHPTKGARI